MYKKILVPLDGSKRAEAILPQVRELAQRFQAEVIFLQVLDTPSLMAAPGRPDMVLYKKELDRRKDQAEAYLKSKQAEFDQVGIESEWQLGREPVIETIIQEAERQEADLIAMSSHGRSGLAKVFYGSVAAGILQRIDRPLLLVRSRTNE